MYYLFIAPLALVLALSVVIWWRENSRGGRGPGIGAAGKGPVPDRAESKVLEKTKQAVGALLATVSGNVELFLAQLTEYENSLSSQRESIRRAVTHEDVDLVEREMIESLDELHANNKAYRAQLAEARKTITLQQDELAKLAVDAGTDALTGLPNRRALDRFLAETVDRSNRYGSSFCALIFDIDRFKEVNDTHGHAVGDEILRAFAELLRGQLRSSDYVARFGGEEFIMILPESSDREAMRMAERILALVQKTPFRVQDLTINVTASCGVSEVYHPKDTPENLFLRMDAALYKAKEQGRNRVVLSM